MRQSSILIIATVITVISASITAYIVHDYSKIINNIESFTLNTAEYSFFSGCVSDYREVVPSKTLTTPIPFEVAVKCKEKASVYKNMIKQDIF